MLLLYLVELAFGRLFLNHSWLGVCVLVWAFSCGLSESYSCLGKGQVHSRKKQSLHMRIAIWAPTRAGSALVMFLLESLIRIAMWAVTVAGSTLVIFPIGKRYTLIYIMLCKRFSLCSLMVSIIITSKVLLFQASLASCRAGLGPAPFQLHLPWCLCTCLGLLLLSEWVIVVFGRGSYS